MPSEQASIEFPVALTPFAYWKRWKHRTFIITVTQHGAGYWYTYGNLMVFEIVGAFDSIFSPKDLQILRDSYDKHLNQTNLRLIFTNFIYRYQIKRIVWGIYFHTYRFSLCNARIVIKAEEICSCRYYRYGLCRNLQHSIPCLNTSYALTGA